MSRHYTPAELAGYRLHAYQDITWNLFGNSIVLVAGPKVPDAVPLNIPRDRRERTIGPDPTWHPAQGAHLKAHRRGLGKVNEEGLSPGVAINAAHPTAEWKIRVGRIDYSMKDNHGNTIYDEFIGPDGRPEKVPRPEEFYYNIPVEPSSFVWHGGYPERPAYDDRSAAFVSATGEIWHLWMYNVKPMEWVLNPNDAATYGRFNNKGELLEGNGGSALGTPWVCTTITKELMTPNQDEWALTSCFISDYHQYDINGNFTDGWITPEMLIDGGLDEPVLLGSTLVLHPDSQSYADAKKLGGDAFLLAQQHATRGMLIDDRSGSIDNRDGLGTNPKPMALRIQADRRWDRTRSSLGQWQPKLGDYVLANEQGYEFRINSADHTPFTQQPAHPLQSQLISAYDAITDMTAGYTDKTREVAQINSQALDEVLQILEQ